MHSEMTAIQSDLKMYDPPTIPMLASAKFGEFCVDIVKLLNGSLLAPANTAYCRHFGYASEGVDIESVLFVLSSEEWVYKDVPYSNM